MLHHQQYLHGGGLGKKMILRVFVLVSKVHLPSFVSLVNKNYFSNEPPPAPKANSRAMVVTIAIGIGR